MFGMFPFMFNGNNSNRNNSTDLSFFNNFLNDDFINEMVDQIMGCDLINELSEEAFRDDYDINFKDFGDYYLIKGYLPGLTAKDVSIDFEKNKAILTIKKKKTYTNGVNAVMTVIQSGGNLTKNFYIEEVDVTKLRASFDNNLLIITMPKVKKPEDIVKKDNISNSDEPTIIDVDNFKVE